MAEHEEKWSFGLKPDHLLGPLMAALVTALLSSLTTFWSYLTKSLAARLPGWLHDPDHLRQAATGVLAASLLALSMLLLLRRGRRRAKIKVEGDRLCLFVARFEGDDKEAVRDRVIASLREVLGAGVAQVSRANLELRLDETVSDVEDEAKKAEEEAQRYLKKHAGHLMIWARPDSEGGTRVIDIRFFSAAHHGEEAKQFGYAPERLRLEERFGKEMGTALAAVAVSLAGIVFSRAGSYLADILKPIARQLEPMVRSLPKALTTDDRGGLLHSYALVQHTIGEQTGESFRLEAAISAYRLALEEWARERVPLDWAMTQNNLGAALRVLGSRESGTARLEEAVAAYRLALEERTRERVPLDWAATQNNLGNALSTLGERESGTARLEEAVTAYRLALEERTRERVPLDWAATQNNLGDTLRALGERERSVERVREAIACYRGGLEEATAEDAPYYHGMIQRGLARAERVLAEMEAGSGG
jgi:tetratricopeptide (TPR) repeat protein